MAARPTAMHPSEAFSGWRRLLLPAALLEESSGRRTPRDWLVDTIMIAFCVGFGVAVLASTTAARSDLVVLLDAVLGIVALVALWWRRSHPAGVAIIVLAISSFSALGAAAGMVALFNSALRLEVRTLAAMTAFGTVCAAVSAMFYGEPNGYDWMGLVVGILLTIIAVTCGLFARAQRDLVHSLHERAHRMEAERRLQDEQAREAERRRIAREMHDVLAHRISLLSVHAGALEFRPDAPPAEIAEAAAVVRGAAHAALQELRDVIGVLREGAEGADGTAPEGADRATAPPQPTLCDLPALVDESRLAGARVALRVDVPEAEAAMPAALGRTAYRIVQEGLTNARKHAPAAAVEVDVEGREGSELVVSVVSRKPVRVAAGAGAGGPGRLGVERPPGAGTGLIGLGERVALAGGTLTHGPDPASGDFVLRAALPWPEAAA